MTDAAHAAIGGSTIERAMLCPGSVKLSATQPNRNSAAAARGTMLHSAMVVIHEQKKTPEDLLRERFTVEGVTLEAADARIGLMKAGAAFRRFVRPALNVMLEKRVRYRDHVWGTADILGATPKMNLVGDFKFGAHLVSVEDNPQMLFYAGAAVVSRVVPLRRTQMAIIQPGRVTLQTAYASEKAVKAFIADVRKTATLAFSAKPPLNPGDVQCLWCPAKNVCPAQGVGRLGAALKRALDT